MTTKRRSKAVLLLAIILTILPFYSSAFLYGEHKLIGDHAFVSFLNRYNGNPDATFFFQSLGLDPDQKAATAFPFLNPAEANQITYGTLNALSGDHENSPFSLARQLKEKNSVIQQIISLHNQYIQKGYLAAPDELLLKLDFRYALLAAVNMSHFYLYGRSFSQQLDDFDPKLIESLANPDQNKQTFKKLGKTNALVMYLTLHLYAIDLAEKAGKIANTNPDKATALIQNAILFNAFADHFLQDAFSSGHLIVNRSVLASLTNNKALHDFYSLHGTTVANRKGEIWTAYGDGQLSKSSPERIEQAVEYSIEEVFAGWLNGKTGQSSFLSQLPRDKTQSATFLIHQIKPLELIPIPYSTKPKDYLPDSLITADLKQATQLLPQRNFLRSRIGNSFVVGLNKRTFSDHYFQGGDFRINFGLFSHRYHYNSSGTKEGQLDNWHGYTISYSYGKTGLYQSGQPDQPIHLFKGGIRSNLDYWVSSTRFIGLSSYLETGIQFQQHKASAILVPSVGLQLGSLLKLNYYNMPTWLRIPAQFLLPLEIRIGSILKPKTTPNFFSGLDLTYAF